MTPPDAPSPHVGEELPGLLLGELDRDGTRRVAAHLRTCAGCRADLVDVAVAVGSIAASQREPGATAGSPAPPREGSPHPGRGRARAVAAVGAVGVAAALFAAGTALGHRSGKSPHPSVTASAALRPVSAPPGAGGEVTLARAGGQVELDIRFTGLPPPGPGRFYEAWLFAPATGKMMAVGVLPPAGSATFEMDGDLLPGYSAIDISLQANDGDPAHSATSVLRAAPL